MLPSMITGIQKRLMRVRIGIQGKFRPREVIRQAKRFRHIFPWYYRPKLTRKIPRGRQMQWAFIFLDIHVQGKPFTAESRPQSVFWMIDIIVQEGEMPELTNEVYGVGHSEFLTAARSDDDLERLRGAQITIC